MTYTNGSGSTITDFITALKDFASGVGWTIDNFDTTNDRLYLHKGVCNACFGWTTNSITDYSSGTGVAITEGILYGTLVNTIGSGNNFWGFTGAALQSSDYTGSGSVVTSYMQGPFDNWWLFSNSTGDYIHAIIQVASDRYRYLFFGNGNDNGLSHGGVAYLISDGGDAWYKYSTGDTAYYNPDTISCMSLRPQAQRWNAACMNLFTPNGLPSGFTNNIAFSSGWSQNSNFAQYVMPLSSDAYNNAASNYPNFEGAGYALLDFISGMQGPEWAAAIPMAGCPLGAVTWNGSASCLLGSISDLRLIDLTNLSPQQEVSVSTDTWQVFPLLRQQPWDLSGSVGPTSGQRGFALKVIS